MWIAYYIRVIADAAGNPMECHLREFACDNRCIPRTKLCDYDIDCTTDGTDESSLLCSKFKEMARSKT